MALSSNGCELSCGRGELGKRGSSCGRWLLYPCGWSSDTARGASGSFRFSHRNSARLRKRDLSAPISSSR